MRMLSILEPGVAKPNFTPLSYTRLNSTYLQERYKVNIVNVCSFSTSLVQNNYIYTMLFTPYL